MSDAKLGTTIQNQNSYGRWNHTRREHKSTYDDSYRGTMSDFAKSKPYTTEYNQSAHGVTHPFPQASFSSCIYPTKREDAQRAMTQNLWHTTFADRDTDSVDPLAFRQTGRVESAFGKESNVGNLSSPYASKAVRETALASQTAAQKAGEQGQSTVSDQKKAEQSALEQTMHATRHDQQSQGQAGAAAHLSLERRVLAKAGVGILDDKTRQKLLNPNRPTRKWV